MLCAYSRAQLPKSQQTFGHSGNLRFARKGSQSPFSFQSLCLFKKIRKNTRGWLNSLHQDFKGPGNWILFPRTQQSSAGPQSDGCCSSKAISNNPSWEGSTSQFVRDANNIPVSVPCFIRYMVFIRHSSRVSTSMWLGWRTTCDSCKIKGLSRLWSECRIPGPAWSLLTYRIPTWLSYCRA